uniref:Uncharacterized protein n=1 Tax=viral metagenome TaxID=1070528 RepID=A0A6M3LDR5_9ZZZZ
MMDENMKEKILNHARGGYIGLPHSFVSADAERSFDSLDDARVDAFETNAKAIYLTMENYCSQAIFCIQVCKSMDGMGTLYLEIEDIERVD